MSTPDLTPKPFGAVETPATYIKATTFTVAVTPFDDVEDRKLGASMWDVSIEWSGIDDLWAVRWMGRCYDVDGHAEFEPSPSNRGDDFLAKYRHPLHVARRVALKVAPTIEINGRTAIAAFRDNQRRR